MGRKYVAIGAILSLLSVAIGAFGAHALKSVLDESAQKTYETGVQYHMVHSLGILIAALLANQWGESRKLLWSMRLLFIGIVLFSGSLYVLSITGVKILGAITPFGGIAFIAGWILLATAALQRK
ncbi:DUF423 domain-containing protein [Paenibacillus sp. CAA11]|uniref:DUF423 domain-containing protein n=1 Tax=Paenibacillus sp. CAA11 TaxID=1532905 RepID=UPI000D36F34E|nr:DUF423 domain-containing protein [Paenibacillus sp. CAA11]AWB44009.1 DUF423 domain-containing protein [Paenibacillus sp. CAA11]